MKILDNLVNARDMAQQHQTTFGRPSDSDLAGLQPGDFVKISRNCERFWVKLTAVFDDVLVGQIANVLFESMNPGLSLDDEVKFERDHVFSLMRPGS